MGQTGECLCSGICWDVLHRGTVSHEKLLYQLWQAVTVLCADDKVCLRQGSSLFRKCLCKASRQHHNGIWISGTQAAEVCMRLSPEAVTVQVFNTITSACSGWVVMVYPAA